VSKAHGVLHVATSDGSINLWAAPKMGGGTCSYVVWDPERNDGGLPADATIISLAARDDHGRILGSSRVR
jgi:hypothetical protein